MDSFREIEKSRKIAAYRYYLEVNKKIAPLNTGPLLPL